MITAEESDCLIKRFVDPVSLHASFGAMVAKERCGVLQLTVLVTVSSRTSLLTPKRHKRRIDSPGTEVWFVARRASSVKVLARELHRIL